jgi:hypothetical protein
MALCPSSPTVVEPSLVLVALVAVVSPPAPTPTAGVDQPKLSIPYVANICFRCFSRFKGMLQLFLIDVAKVYQGMLHMLQVFQNHVASICSKYFICSRNMLQLFFIYILHNVFTHML